ncbi:MAG: xanthine dehydrogenase family protein subunit M [Pseudomonadota bacterium]
MQPFDYMSPTDLAEASEAWAAHHGASRLLSGGTDLTVGLRHGHLSTDLVIDLKSVDELQPRIGPDAGRLRISAGTTMTGLERYLRDHGLFPALQDATSVVGSIQIRNRATLAGNICNASPAADTVPVLAAMGAEVEIYGPSGKRTKSVADFIEGNRKIDLGMGEIVTAVLIPLPKTERGCAFDRITRRRGVDLATTNMCCTISAEGEAIFAFGAVSPRPLVVRDESGALSHPGANAADRAEAIRVLADHAKPISDLRANADYRTAMLCVMADRALDVAHGRLATAGAGHA